MCFDASMERLLDDTVDILGTEATVPSSDAVIFANIYDAINTVKAFLIR